MFDILENCCAFTGHRPSRFSFGYDEENPACINLRRVLFSEIGGLIKKGATTFYTGMALGVDQWAALAVQEWREVYPGVELVAVLPCETQADRWSEDQRRRYFDVILPHVDDTVLISCRYTNTCMMERNRYLVDHAGHLLAVYDGGPKGGTAYTVEYARQQGRRITTIHPDTLRVFTPEDHAANEKRRQFRVLGNSTTQEK